jgi:hypothetical protein
VPGIFDLLAMDGFGIIGTVGFFVPAARLIVIVVGAVVRDRRLAAREAAAEAYETGLKREGLPARPPAKELSDSKGRKRRCQRSQRQTAPRRWRAEAASAVP